MSNIFGRNIKLSIFGESHGEGIGIVIDGIPAGTKLDLDNIRAMLKKRKPGQSKYTTPRNEADEFVIQSGFFNGHTTGTPISFYIKNGDKRSKDYSKTKDLFRPGHADYTGYEKYDGFNDYRGGGHFSARITAPLVIAGAIASQILNERGITIGTRISSVKNVSDVEIDSCKIRTEDIEKFNNSSFPVVGEKMEEKMKEVIDIARKNQDSVGGKTETFIMNLPPGLGSPFFDSLESQIAKLAFSIPAVKAIEFGKGFDITSMDGSQANDNFYIEDDKIKTTSNNNGGINGGISNGMPLVFKLGFKPTPSISQTQKTVNNETKENSEITIEGRHDPCVLIRAVPIVDSIAAIAILDEILGVK